MDLPGPARIPQDRFERDDVSNRTLAVVRCGDSSLHGTWSTPDRDFDVAVSYFGKDERKQFPEASHVHRYKGGKWDGLYDFFAQNPQVIDQYDYFWLPDDDVSSSAVDVNRFIQIAIDHDLQVSQPTLTLQSDYSHLITVHHPRFLLRYTNFVEIMVPLLTRDLMKRTLERMEDSMSGFGFDFIWPSWTKNPLRQVAIVDVVQVHHARKRADGELIKTIAMAGTSNTAELRREMASYGLGGEARIDGVPVPYIRVHGAIDLSGRHVKSRARLATMQLLGRLGSRRDMLVKPSNGEIARHVGKTIHASKRGWKLAIAAVAMQIAAILGILASD